MNMPIYKNILTPLIGISLFLYACQSPQLTTTTIKTYKTQNAPLTATMLKPETIPSDVIKTIMPLAQEFTDKASERRKIEYFNLFNNPIALRIGVGKEAIYMLTLTGTAKTRTDLNVEVRALSSPFQKGFSLNYSGPVTWTGEEQQPQHLQMRQKSPLTFEFIQGLPGNGYTRTYEEYLNALSTHLNRRYQSKPFTFDDSPFIYAIKQGEEIKGFVFTNQHNRLILGERKYADVQNIAFVGQNRTVDAAYTLIGFNQKTATPQSPPEYIFEESSRLGTLVQFGEL